MRKVAATCLLTSAVARGLAAEPQRPRGVGPDFAKFYKSLTTFTCISNPSIQLLISQLNDDYCDCPDGSDEPGTAACSYLSPLSLSTPSDAHPSDVNTTLALPGYYCKNKGHQPSYIAFQNVNDGVCDYDECCDGSDEWAQVGGTKCENRCKEIGKKWRESEEKRQKSMTNATKRRRELVAEAGRIKQQVLDRIQTIGTEIEGSELQVKNLEVSLAELERQERGKVVRAPGKTAGKIGVLAGLAKDRIEELRESLVEVRTQRERAKSTIEELEGILSTFKEEYNPNFNDEGVKRAVRAWEEYAAGDRPSIGDAAHDRDLDEISKPDAESGVIKWEDWQDDEESDVDVLYKIEEYLPTPVRDWVDGKLRSLRLLMIENGILAPTRDPNAESKAVTDARDALRAAESSLSDLKHELETHKEDLEKDYGVDDVFRALKGQCISTDSGEYTYELCWLDRTTQKSKKGGGHTGMGNYVGIGTIVVDDEVPADGKGLGSGERVTLKYENGQHCWNGPNRSTMVVLACAEENEVWRVVELEKCVYQMEVGTPAVCGMEGSKAKEGVRDEL